MTQQIGFAGQLQPQQLKEVAERGFKSVINNRPDYEEGAHQPTAA
ncbi:MAG: TIGR01244 family phosphatase, partial [Pseudomonadales bacterium]|nr:TIGR01244 family phosphatase [Pseudomonadales bacterium]